MEQKRMQDDYVRCWWARGEFAEQHGDWQTGASLDQPGSDLLGDDTAVTAMQATPLGEPPIAFDVRSTYDSRPVNAYDFNFSQNQAEVSGGSVLIFLFNVPVGYRAVPRKWSVMLSIPTSPTSGNFNEISFQTNGGGVPNNQGIIFGSGGTDEPIETFFLCEEQTTFGCTLDLGPTISSGGQAVVNVYGNLIPVTTVALPFSIANETK
jgi:hypothetical protein